VPPVVDFVCEAANLSEEERLKTFNMGLGMVLIVAPDKAAAVTSVLEEAGEKVSVVGTIVPGTGAVEYAR
jgi:phosphoribosylformylglycinamidine cyclo-ligase